MWLTPHSAEHCARPRLEFSYKPKRVMRKKIHVGNGAIVTDVASTRRYVQEIKKTGSLLTISRICSGHKEKDTDSLPAL